MKKLNSFIKKLKNLEFIESELFLKWNDNREIRTKNTDIIKTNAWDFVFCHKCRTLIDRYKTFYRLTIKTDKWIYNNKILLICITCMETKTKDILDYYKIVI